MRYMIEHETVLEYPRTVREHHIELRLAPVPTGTSSSFPAPSKQSRQQNWPPTRTISATGRLLLCDPAPQPTGDAPEGRGGDAEETLQFEPIPPAEEQECCVKRFEKIRR